MSKLRPEEPLTIVDLTPYDGSEREVYALKQGLLGLVEWLESQPGPRPLGLEIRLKRARALLGGS